MVIGEPPVKAQAGRGEVGHQLLRFDLRPWWERPPGRRPGEWSITEETDLDEVARQAVSDIRSGGLPKIDRFASLEGERKRLQTHTEELQAKRNALSKQIGQLKGKGGDTSALMAEINASIRFDKRLWREDIAASKAHAAMLGETGIITQEDAAAILAGLDTIEIQNVLATHSDDLVDTITPDLRERLDELLRIANPR